MAVRIATSYDAQEQQLLNTLESTSSTDTARSAVTSLKKIADAKWNSINSLTDLATEISARENLPGYGIDTAIYNGWLELLYADDKVAKGYTDADLVATARSLLKRSDYTRYEYIYHERKPFMDRVSAANAAEEAARAHVFGRVKQSGTSTDTTKTDSAGVTTLTPPSDPTTTSDGTPAASTGSGTDGTTVGTNAGGAASSGVSSNNRYYTRVFNNTDSPYDPTLLDKRPAWMDTNIEHHKTKSGTGFVVDSAIIKRYYSVIDAEIYFGNEYVEDVYDINWVVNQNVLPLFGYNSYTYDEIARGNRLISGNFTINFTSPNYLFSILEAANSGTTGTITSLEDYTVPALDADSEITYRKNTLGSKISGHHAAMWPQTFDIDIIFGENSAAGQPVHIILTGCALQACQQVLSASAVGSPPVVMEQYSFIGQDIRTVVTSAIGISTVTDAGTIATNSANVAGDAISQDPVVDNTASTPIVTLKGSDGSPNDTLVAGNGDYTITGGDGSTPTIGSGSQDGRILTIPKTNSSGNNSGSNKNNDNANADGRNKIQSAANTDTYKAPTTDTNTDRDNTNIINVDTVDSDTAYYTITDPEICRLIKKFGDTEGTGLTPEEQKTLGDYLNKVKGQTVNNDGLYYFNYQNPDTGELISFSVDDPTIATVAAGNLPYSVEEEKPSVFTIEDYATCLALSRLAAQKLPPEKQKSLGSYMNLIKQNTYTTADSEGNPVYHFNWIKPVNSYTGITEPVTESFECNDVQIARLMSGEYPYELDVSVQDDSRIYTILYPDICRYMLLWQQGMGANLNNNLTSAQQQALGNILDEHKLETHYVPIDDPSATAYLGEQDYRVYYYYSHPETQMKTLFKITYSSIKVLLRGGFPYLVKEGFMPERANILYIIDDENCELITRVHKNPCGLTVKEQKQLGLIFNAIVQYNNTYWDGPESDKNWYVYYKNTETGEKTLFSVRQNVIDGWKQGNLLYDPDYTGTEYLGVSAPDPELPNTSSWPRVESAVISRFLDRYIKDNERLSTLSLIEQKQVGVYLDGIKDDTCSEEVLIAGDYDTRYYFTYDSEYFKKEYQTASFTKTTLEYMATLDITDDSDPKFTNISDDDNREYYRITDTEICKYIDVYTLNEEGLTKTVQQTLAAYIDDHKALTYQNLQGWCYFYYNSFHFKEENRTFICDEYMLKLWRNGEMSYNPNGKNPANPFAHSGTVPIVHGRSHIISKGQVLAIPSEGIKVRYDGYSQDDGETHFATVDYTKAPEPVPTPSQMLSVCIKYKAVTYVEGATYDCTYYSYNNGKSFKLSYFQTS